MYASTRADELRQVPHWGEPERAAFLAMQFDAQRSHYRTHFPHARFDIIEQAGKPVGRLYLDLLEGELRLIDIALLPEYRGRGTGARLMSALLEFAGEAHLGIVLHVEEQNPVRRLYERLGFKVVGEQSFYLTMACNPGVPASTFS